MAGWAAAFLGGSAVHLLLLIPTLITLQIYDRVLSSRSMPTLLMLLAAAGFSLAAWWVVLGGLGLAFPGLPRAVFAPLANGWDARHGRRVFAASLVGLVVWGGFAYRIGTAAQ